MPGHVRVLTVVGLQTQSPAHARLGMQSHGERPQNWERCFARPVDLRGHGSACCSYKAKESRQPVALSSWQVVRHGRKIRRDMRRRVHKGQNISYQYTLILQIPMPSCTAKSQRKRLPEHVEPMSFTGKIPLGSFNNLNV